MSILLFLSLSKFVEFFVEVSSMEICDLRRPIILVCCLICVIITISPTVKSIIII